MFIYFKYSYTCLSPNQERTKPIYRTFVNNSEGHLKQLQKCDLDFQIWVTRGKAGYRDCPLVVPGLQPGSALLHISAPDKANKTTAHNSLGGHFIFSSQPVMGKKCHFVLLSILSLAKERGVPEATSHCSTY